MNERVAEKLSLETRLHKALESGQLMLHYQPKLDLATGAIAGIEALLRWNDPETGLVPPARFIPLLEETGMILDAGRCIVRQALDDHSRWRAQGLVPPPIGRFRPRYRVERLASHVPPAHSGVQQRRSWSP